MDEGVVPPEVTPGPSSDYAMDLDFMEELLLGGCWLETADGSDFLVRSPSPSGALFESTPLWPKLETSNSKSASSPSEEKNQEERKSSDLQNYSEASDPQLGTLVSRSENQTAVCVSNCSNQLESIFMEGSELNRVFWIGPRAYPFPGSSVMERLVRALSYIKDSASNKDVLVQLWVPVSRGGTRVLTTSHQPFSIGSTNQKLTNYRNISVNYQFAAEENTNVTLGLPGRVFTGKVPEWTPDVRFFRIDEYPRVGHAQQFDVRGTLALPVFEQDSHTCLGVVEVVMTNQKVNYRPELESVCRALEAVDLRSSDLLGAKNVQGHNSSYQAALPEILDVLKTACATHGLPLAQTWVPCIQQGKQGCRHSDENLIHCVSTVDSACFLADHHIQPFHEACSEHHLLKGQGVAGKAFMTNQPCFSADITAYGKTEYPLSHHARMFGLCAAVAIRLRSIFTGLSDFVLEFFLPRDCRDPEEQKKMLSSLSAVIQRVCRSLRVLTDEELEQENSVPANNVIVLSDDSADREKISRVGITATASSSQDDSSGFAVQQKNNLAIPMFTEDRMREVLYGKCPELWQSEQDPTTAESSVPTIGKTGEKRRTKAERGITLEVLRQHFAGSLKDAAKSLGVCPTTLKRICRQHGIKRWPSRKIRKVGHSLQKLQVVIDSVQGASGSLQIGSFYSNFPELASPNLSRTNPFPASTPSLNLQPPPPAQEPEDITLSPRTAISKSPSSSCSQGSSSSHSCSTGTQQHRSTHNSEDPLAGENTSECSLKGSKSGVELHALSQDGRKPFPRSQSHMALVEHQNMDSCPPLQRRSGMSFLEGDAWRIKVAYGEEKIRFRMLKSWGFNDLVQEVMKRFNIYDFSGFHLKYLDDDFEWVLLTCDADMEECIDICGSSNRQTIKLSLSKFRTIIP